MTLTQALHPVRIVVTVALATIVVVLSWGASPVAEAAATAAPTSLRVVSRTPNAASLTWSAANAAPRYRVKYSTSSAFLAASYKTTTTTQLDLSGLSPATTYYVAVRSVSADNTTALSPYSATVSFKTREATSLLTVLNPTSVSAQPEPTMPTSAIRVRWVSRGNGYGYRVRTSASSTMSSPTYYRFTSAGGAIARLTPGQTLYVQVAVMSTQGQTISDYGRPVTVQTDSSNVTIHQSADTTSLRVGSYNVRCAACYVAGTLERPWIERLPSVAATIQNQDVDVLGVQETSASLQTDTRTGTKSPQYTQLVNELGSGYAATNSVQYNCQKSTSSTNCTYVDKGASGHTRIIYRTARLTLIASGSRRLSELATSYKDRYLAWAIFQQKATGKRFFFANVHLDPTKDAAGSTTYSDLRKLQATEAMSTINDKNTSGLPVILVGDFNSHRSTPGGNAPYDVVTASGLVDHLGGTYLNTSDQPGADVEHRVRTYLHSNNNWKAVAPGGYWLNGSYISCVFTSPMRMVEYENVANVDAAGAFVPVVPGGVALPSDHNMQRATVVLP